MFTVLNKDQLNNKIIDGDKIIDNLSLTGNLSVSGSFSATDATSTLSLNSGIALSTSTKFTVVAGTQIGIATSTPDAAYKVTIGGSTKIEGDLNITGSLNYTSSETVSITDNTLLLNSNWTTAATEDAGLEVERGTYTNSKLYWSESGNYWALTRPVDDANAATGYRVVDDNYGDSRYLQKTGATMTGDITFGLTVSAASKGIVWSGLTDSHSIFVEEYGGSQSTRLVIKNTDDGDSDYTIFRNGATDVFEIHQTYVQSNKNMNITDKKLTINGTILSTQSETIPAYSSGSNLHMYLKDNMYIHSSVTSNATIRLYAANDSNYMDLTNDGSNMVFNIYATQGYYFKNVANATLTSISSTGVLTTRGDTVSGGDLYVNGPTVTSTGGTKIGNASTGFTLMHNYDGGFLIASGWDWDRAGGMKVNISNATFDIGTANKFGKLNSANLMTAGIRLLNPTEVQGNLTVSTSGEITVSTDNYGVTMAGARVWKKSGAGLRIKPHLDTLGVTITDTTDADVLVIKKDATTYNGLLYHGKKVWNEGNDGSGSGLDADSIDTKHLTDLVLRDGTQTMTGLLTLSGDPTSALHAVTKQYLDRKVSFINVNGLKATDPIDRYSAGATVVMKWNVSYGSWPYAAGVVVTYSSKDTSNDNQTGTLYPGSVHQIAYSESGYAMQHRYAVASMTYTGVTAWTASTAASLNAYKMPTSANENGKFYKCTTAGTSGATEPVWPSSGTVTDGTIVWTYQGEFWSAWDKIWTQSTDGNGSGLDADTVKGYTPANKAGDTFTGDVKLSKLIVTGEIINDNSSGETRVKVNDNLYVTGTYAQDGESLTINSDNTNADVYLYLNSRNSGNTANWNPYISTDKANGRLAISDPIYLPGEKIQFGPTISDNKIDLWSNGSGAFCIGIESYHNVYGATSSYGSVIGHKFYRGAGELIAQIGYGQASGSAANRLDSYFAGKVGIGITATNKLHIKGENAINTDTMLIQTNGAFDSGAGITIKNVNTATGGSSNYGRVQLQFHGQTQDANDGWQISQCRSGIVFRKDYNKTGTYSDDFSIQHRMDLNVLGIVKSDLTPVLVATQTGRIGIMNDTPSEALSVTGNISVTGTVDGVDVAALKTTVDPMKAAYDKRARYTKSLTGSIAANTATTLTTIDASWTGTWLAQNIVLVIIDGQIQAPGIDYNASGTNTITFLGNIPSGTVLEIIIM